MDSTTLSSTFAATVPAWIPVGGAVLIFLALWSVFWKGIALWHAGRRAHVKWFIALLIVNTVGILDIIYLFGILKLKFANLFSK